MCEMEKTPNHEEEEEAQEEKKTSETTQTVDDYFYDDEMIPEVATGNAQHETTLDMNDIIQESEPSEEESIYDNQNGDSTNSVTTVVDPSQYYFLYQPKEKEETLDLFARYSPKEEERCSLIKCWLFLFQR